MSAVVEKLQPGTQDTEPPTMDTITLDILNLPARSNGFACKAKAKGVTETDSLTSRSGSSKDRGTCAVAPASRSRSTLAPPGRPKDNLFRSQKRKSETFRTRGVMGWNLGVTGAESVGRYCMPC